MEYIEAPNDVYGTEIKYNANLFLAGGITNCPDWQAEFVEKFKENELSSQFNVYNPRRKDFPIEDPNASDEQISWEYDKLAKADMIVFWFSRGSLNPIVLYELGRWGNSQETQIYIGMDTEYTRKQDVEMQTMLSKGPDFPFYNNIDDIIKQIFFDYYGILL